MLISKLTVAAGAALIAFSAHSGTVSSEFELPLSETTTDIFRLGTLDKFDTSLGTLTGATLFILGSATTTWDEVTSNAATSSPIRAQSLIEFSYNTSIAGIVPTAPQLDVNFETPTDVYAPGQTRVFGPFHEEVSNSFDLSSSLVSLSGPGQFDVNCFSLTTNSTSGGGGNVVTKQTTTADCGARIEYTFDDAPTPQLPEPSSLALVGLGLAAAARAAKRRKV